LIRPLKLGLENLYSARRGGYRVMIYRIEAELRKVTVMAIEHRSVAHRPHQH
jgi:mRNA-degrading endonuclease RelE of RelBE toxin-antitoxin system